MSAALLPAGDAGVDTLPSRLPLLAGQGGYVQNEPIDVSGAMSGTTSMRRGATALRPTLQHPLVTCLETRIRAPSTTMPCQRLSAGTLHGFPPLLPTVLNLYIILVRTCRSPSKTYSMKVSPLSFVAQKSTTCTGPRSLLPRAGGAASARQENAETVEGRRPAP